MFLWDLLVSFYRNLNDENIILKMPNYYETNILRSKEEHLHLGGVLAHTKMRLLDASNIIQDCWSITSMQDFSCKLIASSSLHF